MCQQNRYTVLATRGSLDIVSSNEVEAAVGDEQRQLSTQNAEKCMAAQLTSFGIDLRAVTRRRFSFRAIGAKAEA